MAAAPDASRDDELRDAEVAFNSLVDGLRQLISELDTEPGSRAHRNIAKLTAAQTSLLRHAEAVIAAHAFLDGHKLETPDPSLLTVFYTTSSEASASRYCWALLHFRSPLQLPQILTAAEIEHDAFQGRHAAGGVWGTRSLDLHADQADRLSYRLAVLQRTMIVQRAFLPVTDDLSEQVAFLTNAVAEADDVIQAMRLEALRLRRQNRKKPPEGDSDIEGDGS